MSAKTRKKLVEFQMQNNCSLVGIQSVAAGRAAGKVVKTRMVFCLAPPWARQCFSRAGTMLGRLNARKKRVENE